MTIKRLVDLWRGRLIRESSDETSGRIKIGLVLGKVSVKVRFKNHNASSSLNRVEKKDKNCKKKLASWKKNVCFLLIRVVEHRLLSALPFYQNWSFVSGNATSHLNMRLSHVWSSPVFRLYFIRSYPTGKNRSTIVHCRWYTRTADIDNRPPSIDGSRIRFKTRTRTSRNYRTKAIFHGRTSIYLLYFTGNIQHPKRRRSPFIWICNNELTCAILTKRQRKR